VSLPPPLPASLPAGGEDHRLHPWSWLFVLLMQLRHYFLPLVALLVFGQRGDRDPMWAQLIPLSAIAALVLVSVLQYLSYRYRIGSDAITVRSGLLARNRREIPFARIHNVEVRQNPLHRLFGVAELRLESAGGVRPEAEMRVLKLDQALALERLVRQRGQAPQAADVVAAPSITDADTEQVLLRLSSWDVVRMGLLSNRGWALAIAAFGVLFQTVPRPVMDAAIQRGGRKPSAMPATCIPAWPAPSCCWPQPAAGLAGAACAVGGADPAALSRLHPQRAGSPPDRVGRPAQPHPQQWRVAASRPGRCAKLHRWFGLRQLRIDSAAGGPSRDEDRALRELAPLAPASAASSWCSTCCLNCSGRRRNGSPFRSVAGGGCAWARCCWCRCWQRPRTGAGDHGA
jgi:putative membrane protein